MSKAGDIIDKVKRHQFWILCGVVSLVGLVSWWMATRGLAKEYAQGKSKIESEASKIATVRGVEPHPNEKWNIDVGTIVERERKDVETAWKQLYDQQKAKVFIWPADVLEQDFVDYVETLKPGDELPDELLARYWNSMQKQFQKLAKLVDAEYEDPSQSSGVFGRERQPIVQPVVGAVPHKVTWLDQAIVQKPYDWQERPTTRQVLYAQEEIWVLTAICEAIKTANEGSSGAHDAAVQIIEEMAVGYLAAEEYPNGSKEPGRVTRVTAPATAAVTVGYGTAGPGVGIGSAGDGADGGFGGAAGRLVRPTRPDITVTGGVQVGYGATTSGPGGVAADTTAAAPAGADDYLNEWRYVDGKSKPLLATELASPPFHEYRLMPWKVRMTVDQRKWDDLLVAFRNTQLPLAIRQVRVNPDSGQAGFDPRGGAVGSRGDGGRGGYGASRGGYGAAGGTRMPHAAGRGGYGAAAARGIDQGFGGGAGTQGSAPTITLELRGVAYLMNPPDFSKIGVAGASEPSGDSAAPTADVSAAPVTAAPAADAASGEFGVAPAPAPVPVPVAPPAAGGGGRR